MVLSTAGLISLLYGLSSFSSSENLVLTCALIVIGIAIIGLYAYRQLHLDEPMLRIDILKTPQYRTTVVIVALFQAALIGMETIMPLYIQGVLGQSATVSGLTLLPGALIGAFTGLLAGRLFDRHGVRRPVLCGAIAIIAGVAGLVSLRADSPIAIVSVFYAVIAVGIQFTMTPVNTWGVNSLPNEAVPHAQSTGNTINQVAASFGTALLVSVSSAASGQASWLEGTARTFFGYHASFCATAFLAVCSVALILLFVRDRKAASAQAGAPKATGAGSVATREGAKPNRLAIDDPSPAFAKVADTALAGLTLEQAMNPHAATVRDTATMGEVVELIADTDTTGVSVVDGEGRLVGYVTDGDIMRYLARLELNVANPSAGVSLSVKDEETLESRIAALGSLNVMDLATKRVISVEANTPLDVACGALAKNRIKKVPVTRDGVLIGALSRRNILHSIILNNAPAASNSQVEK